MSGSVAAGFAMEPTLRGTCLQAETARIIREGLEAYRCDSGSLAIALIDPSGASLIQNGQTQEFALDSLGVLATAAIGATQMFAQHLGDQSFGGICHQGQKTCAYLAPLNGGFVLLALYPAGTDVSGIRQSLVNVVRRLNKLVGL